MNGMWLGHSWEVVKSGAKRSRRGPDGRREQKQAFEGFVGVDLVLDSDLAAINDGNLSALLLGRRHGHEIVCL